MFDKVNESSIGLDEESVLFETQMTIFQSNSEDRNSMLNERRSGVKKVDDEHLIRLAK